MKYKKLMTGLVAVLFCLGAAGVSFSLEFDESASMSSADRSTNFVATHDHPDFNANWVAISSLPYEADLVDTYEYQSNVGSYIQHDHAEAVKPGDLDPCAIAMSYDTTKCREFDGGWGG